MQLGGIMEKHEMKMINARFIGQSSCGFVHGRTYSIFSRIKNDMIWIYDRGSDACCPYKSLGALLANWQF